MHSWNLEKLYENRVKGQLVPVPDRLKVINEMELYKKTDKGFEPLGTVDDDYYETTVSKYIKLGSQEGIEQRKMLKTILSQAKADSPYNLDIFGSYLLESGITLTEENLAVSKSIFVDCMQNSKQITLSSLLKQAFGGDIAVFTEHFVSVWGSEPAKIVKHGRVGPGEIFLTAFCGGTKPNKGDIYIDGTTVEVKGADGRLYKTNRIDDSKALEILNELEPKDKNSLIDAFSEVICIYANTPSLRSEVKGLLLNENIFESLKKNYDTFKVKGRLPDRDMFRQLAGICQLLEYKKVEGFDTILFFSGLSNKNIYLQFLNMSDIDSVESLYFKIIGLESSIFFSRRVDGSGYSVAAYPKK